MNKKYNKFFVGIIFALLALPMTFFIGISETTTTDGTESITPIPSIQEKSFQDKKFQPLFESWWNSHFAFRKTMLKTKNTIYDWANFGKMHSGSQQTIIQGKENIIYQRYERHMSSVFSKVSELLGNLFEEKGDNLPRFKI